MPSTLTSYCFSPFTLLQPHWLFCSSLITPFHLQPHPSPSVLFSSILSLWLTPSFLFIFLYSDFIFSLKPVSLHCLPCRSHTHSSSHFLTYYMSNYFIVCLLSFLLDVSSMRGQKCLVFFTNTLHALRTWHRVGSQ